jgi:hypothetical protein
VYYAKDVNLGLTGTVKDDDSFEAGYLEDSYRLQLWMLEAWQPPNTGLSGQQCEGFVRSNQKTMAQLRIYPGGVEVCLLFQVLIRFWSNYIS